MEYVLDIQPSVVHYYTKTKKGMSYTCSHLASVEMQPLEWYHISSHLLLSMYRHADRECGSIRHAVLLAT